MDRGNTGPLEIFINYRRSDAAGEAHLVYNALAERFGADNVFLDVVSLTAGSKWLDAIRSRSAGSGALLVLIGPRWVSILNERARQRLVDHEEDHVRAEIELGLKAAPQVRIVPVLIGDAPMPNEAELPRALRALVHYEAVRIRHEHLNDDVERLIRQLERMPSEPATAAAEPRAVEVEAERARLEPPEEEEEAEPVVPRPTRAHYDEVARWFGKEAAVVPLIGPGVNTVDGDGEPATAERLPDARELAVKLADGLGESMDSHNLAHVSQYVCVMQGKVDLYKALRRLLACNSPPASVHRFLAQAPAMLRELGVPRPYQLIVTTNYDDALERAFDEAQEEYDLAVYMAAGEHRGKFIHVPFDRRFLPPDHDGTPQPIGKPNGYVDFPIEEDDDGELKLHRTVIVKVHGTVDTPRAAYPWKGNYVITEDDYIAYLSQEPIESLVPLQIREKLLQSHLLFLGYSMRDWNFRVFLQRVWSQQPVGAKSWAIQPDPDELERQLWTDFGVELYAAPLQNYARTLHERLAARVRT